MSSLKFNFAQAAEILDCSVRFYQMMEAGENFPSFPNAVKLAKFFELDIAALSDEEIPFYV